MSKGDLAVVDVAGGGVAAGDEGEDDGEDDFFHNWELFELRIDRWHTPPLRGTSLKRGRAGAGGCGVLILVEAGVGDVCEVFAE